jgi:hypothetical protein
MIGEELVHGLNCVAIQDVSKENNHIRPLTLFVWFQLGELRRFSEGEISERGRGMALVLLVGEDIGVLFLEMRKGCT